MSPTQKKLLATMLVSLSIVGVIRGSRHLIDLFWLRPSRFEGTSWESWPERLNFKIPNPYSGEKKIEYLYFVTDQFGAVRSEKKILAPVAWIFGDFRTANLLFPPALRWSNLIGISNRNFAIPRFNFFDLGAKITVLKAKLSEKPKWVFLGDGIGRWLSLGDQPDEEYFSGFTFPDLSPFWIWGRLAKSSSLFEALCFYWTSPFCQFRQSTRTSFNPRNDSIPPLSQDKYLKRLTRVRKKLTQIKVALGQEGIEIVGLTEPYASREPVSKKERNNFLRSIFSQLNISFIDVEKCFEKHNAPDEYFGLTRAGMGHLTVEGNKLFADCVDEGISKL